MTRDRLSALGLAALLALSPGLASGADWGAVEIAGIRFDLVKPCARCIMTTQDQLTGARGGADPMPAMRKLRMSTDRRVPGVLFGWNAVPRGRGRHAHCTFCRSAYQRSTCGATAASMRLRLIFMVGVSWPFSIVHGSFATTIMRSCS